MKTERDLLKFIKEDNHFSRYYDAIYILFHTGLRISEFCGLTIPDINIRFLCLDKNDMPMVALHWEKYFQHIVEKYNKIYKIQIPKITPHVCRHTYCSHCASGGMNPKHLQYLMGHSDIGVTLNTYTHIDFDNVKKEVKSLEKAVL